MDFIEKFRTKPENAMKAAARTAARSKTRIDRSATSFVKLHRVQTRKLKALHDPILFYVFVLLLEESFNKYGEPFELPTPIPGLTDMRRLRVRLRKLEHGGLISIIARPSKPLLIQVPLTL